MIELKINGHGATTILKIHNPKIMAKRVKGKMCIYISGKNACAKILYSESVRKILRNATNKAN